MQIPKPVLLISTRWFCLLQARAVEASAQACSPEGPSLWGQEMSGWMFSWGWIPPLIRFQKWPIRGLEKPHALALSKNWLDWACQGPGDLPELRFYKSAFRWSASNPHGLLVRRRVPGPPPAQRISAAVLDYAFFLKLPRWVRSRHMFENQVGKLAHLLRICKNNYFILKKYIYFNVLLERGEGKEEERKRNICV